MLLILIYGTSGPHTCRAHLFNTALDLFISTETLNRHRIAQELDTYAHSKEGYKNGPVRKRGVSNYFFPKGFRIAPKICLVSRWFKRKRFKRESLNRK